MKAGEAIAEILKREGVEIIFGYPVNHILELAARAGIRPIIVRQERIGLHMADAMSRLTSGAEDRRVRDAARARRRERVRRRRAGLWRGGAAPGAADGLSAPDRACAAELQLGAQHAARHQVGRAGDRRRRGRRTSSGAPSPASRPAAARRCWSRCRSTCSTRRCRSRSPTSPRPCRAIGPDPDAVRAVAKRLAGAKRPVIYAGQGVHYARAWAELQAARRAARRAGHHEPRRQERVPREPQARARLGRQRDPGDRRPLPASTPT